MQPVETINPPESGSVNVAFVISQHTEPIDLVGPWQVFQDVSIPQRVQTVKEMHPFNLYTVSDTTETIQSGRGLEIRPNFSFDDAPPPRVIVVPAQRGRSKRMMGWILQNSNTCDVIMSVCTGSYVLGQAGLLDGLEATTHHLFVDDFAKQFPSVKVLRGLRFVENHKISTSGGLSAGIDLALRVVQRYFGTEVAESTADYLEYQGKSWMR